MGCTSSRPAEAEEAAAPAPRASTVAARRSLAGELFRRRNGGRGGGSGDAGGGGRKEEEGEEAAPGSPSFRYYCDGDAEPREAKEGAADGHNGREDGIITQCKSPREEKEWSERAIPKRVVYTASPDT